MEENKEIPITEAWLQWLQARIPSLKESGNAFWIKQALSGCSDEHMDKQAEFIAEKAELKPNGQLSICKINKQSIINAGDEYKNSVK